MTNLEKAKELKEKINLPELFKETQILK